LLEVINKMIETSFLDQLNRFSLIVNKRVTSNYAGERRSIAEGQGIIFKDHRIYVPGDDIRKIDWKLFARTDRLYIKKFEEERNLAVHIIVDHSASMAFGKPYTKFDYAGMIGLGFAYLAMKDNEKFQFSTFSDDLRIFKPRRGRSNLLNMVDHLNSVKPKGSSKFYENLSSYMKLVKSRSLIVIISDFLIDLEEIKSALYLFGDHDIRVVQVLDAKERNLAIEGDLRLHDVETKGIMRTFISKRLKSHYENKLEDHISSINSYCDALGIKFFTVTTDKPLFDVFYDILK